MTEDTDGEDRVAAEIAKLPQAFRLHGFPGDHFRVSPSGSYVNESGEVTIYLQVCAKEPECEPVWKDHSKGTLRKILGELLDHDGDRRFANDDEVCEYLGWGEQPDQHLLDRLEED